MGKGLANKKKYFFETFLKIMFPIANKTYFILRGFNKTTYQYSSVHCWQSRGFFLQVCCNIWQKFCFSLKILEIIFLSKSVSGYFKTKKSSDGH